MPAARHYTAQDNGLVQPWSGRVYLNPPFGPGVERGFSKLYLERSADRTTEAIVLWKSATETSAWKTLYDDIVSGVFSSGTHPVCRSFRR